MPELHNPVAPIGTKVEQLDRRHRIPEGWKPYRWNGDPRERFEPKIPEEPVRKSMSNRPLQPCGTNAAYQRGCDCQPCHDAYVAKNKADAERRRQRKAADKARRAEMKREREAK